MSDLQQTPLTELHRKLGARLVPFAGFSMPVQYRSILEEHKAAREQVALFDVSHMGQLHLSGAEAIATAERLVTCRVASLRVGRVRYGMLCNEDGGVVDDVTVYRTADDAVMLCVNASNIEKDYRWVVRHTPDGVDVRNASAATALLALQGPKAVALTQPLAPIDLGSLRRFRFGETTLADCPVLLSNTGYTGSEGFEIYADAAHAEALWTALTEGGATPAGLGARDTLRLEAALPLYGHELDDETSPLEAGLDRFVKLEEGGFIGAEAILQRREAGHRRALAGFVLEGRGIARADHVIASNGDEVGRVTSGAPSPTLGKSIGLGYVPPSLAEPGASFQVIVRGRPIDARAVETPFYRRP